MKSRTRKTKLSRCSPKINSNNFTCFNDSSLSVLKQLWNMRNKHDIIAAHSGKDIWRELKKRLKHKCQENEKCWLKQEFVHKSESERIIESDFAPQAPNEWKNNPNAWLSSDDINSVLKQYEKIYKCFKFLGPSPIDFDKQQSNGNCVWNDLCKFDLKTFCAKGVNKIGISFNTDTNDGPGEHWVSLFINLKKNFIFYYDSAGYRVPAQIKRFVDRVMKQAEGLNPPQKLIFDQNHPVSHQYKNTECGIYSIFFLVHMLEDKITPQYLKTHVIKDEYIQTFRKIYFNDH